MRNLWLGVSLFGVLLTTVPAFAAGPRDARVNRRQCRHQRRIAQGVEKGQLTPREARRLERHQARLQQREARMKQDGRLSGRERRRLRRALRQQSREIYRLRHNSRRGDTPEVAPAPRSE